ncbi:MAG: nucleotidyl transferase AbiEii/AbiGii toxin family protein [Eubacterium sp.]|nr:nucleotidyl transferase AbiEii/AbiGii toxin family protein [Eubacterium sp.]
MIKTARQLKDLIRNLSKKNAADTQLLMRSYMMERFLERVSLSTYRDKFILKGGMLVAAMVGLNARSTMDLDATVSGTKVNEKDVEKMMAEIITVPIDDGIFFQVKSISEIMDEAEYPGIRVTMTTLFDGVRTPLKVDISTGDVITPKAIRYSFKLMLEDRSIDVLAYNLETVLAEKLETIITRTTTNTRMRDFYDIAILLQLYGDTLSQQVLCDALLATAHKRGTERNLPEAIEVFNELENSLVMQKLWAAYQRKFSYASDLNWGAVMDAVRQLYGDASRYNLVDGNGAQNGAQ